MGNGSICVGTILASSQEQGLQDDVILVPDCLDPGELHYQTGAQLTCNILAIQLHVCAKTRQMSHATVQCNGK